MARKNVLVATGIPVLNKGFFESERVKQLFNVVATVDNKLNIKEELSNHPETEILLVSDGLVGKGMSLTQIMIDVRFDFPNVRVVYLTSEIKKQQLDMRMKQLGPLARARIYDIVSQTPIRPQHIARALTTPATEDNVEWIFDYINNEEEMNAPKETIEVASEGVNKDDSKNRGIIDNLHVFSSIKPGTGKSFISANIATIIAKYGVKNEKGEAPRVALIDGDMQNLSIGTLLQVENKDKNLRTVIDKIHTVLDETGREVDNPPLVADARAFVKSAMLPYEHVKNLDVLAGSQIKYEDLTDFKALDFVWLLQVIKDSYDVIIMDSSSSLDHVSTAPMMLLAKDLFYILNLDYNNIRNNSRYQSTLINSLNVFDRVKYILNENITSDQIKEQGWKENLEFDKESIASSGFDMAGSVPLIEKPTFLNRIFLGEPVVLDNQDHTLEARVELGRIANQIWEIEKLPILEEQLERKQNAQLGKRKKLFGKK